MTVKRYGKDTGKPQCRWTVVPDRFSPYIRAPRPCYKPAAPGCGGFCKQHYKKLMEVANAQKAG